MSVRSLNEALKNFNELMVVVDRHGNVPRRVRPTYEEGELFNKYWSDDRMVDESVVRVHDKPALALHFTFNMVWACKLLDFDFLRNVDPLRPRVLATAKEVAEKVIGPMAPGCHVFVGNGTLDGEHEVLLALPYEMRDRFDKFIDKLCDTVYDEAEKILEATVGPRIVLDPKDLSSMREMMAKYAGSESYYLGKGEEGEIVKFYFFTDHIVAVTLQDNGWTRTNTYWENEKVEERFSYTPADG